jgi:hypothetical protein
VLCGARYELDSTSLALDTQQPTGLHVEFIRR